MNLKLNLLKLYMLQVKYNHVRQNCARRMMRRWFLTIQPFLANFGSTGPYYLGRTFLSNGDKVYSRLPFVSVLCGESFPFSRFPVFADFRFSEPMIYKFSPPSDNLWRWRISKQAWATWFFNWWAHHLRATTSCTIFVALSLNISILKVKFDNSTIV